jgi:uncharacterized membrane protein
MAKDLGDTIGTAVGRVAREAAQTVAQNARKSNSKNSPVSGLRGVAVGAGLAGLAAGTPLAVKGVRKLKNGLGNGGNPLEKPVEKAGEKLKGAASDVVDKEVQDAGGPGGIAKEAGKSLIPGLGGGDSGSGGSGGQPGVGKGRRMPVQQSVDVGAPIQNVYNQFTQFEEWPNFMHRVTSVSQEDETNVSFKSKIWGVSKEFKAEIDEQRPDERIKWHVTEGLSHQGVATFHELAPRLTRIEVSVDVEPGSLIEKFARGARHVKRAMRADLHRFKAYIMMNEEEDGEWRGTVEDGEVKQARSSSDAKSSDEESNGSSSGSGRSRSNAKSGSPRSSGSKSSSRSGGSSSGRARAASSSSNRRRSSSSSAKSSGSSNKRTARAKSSNGADPAKSGSSRRKSGSRS